VTLGLPGAQMMGVASMLQTERELCKQEEVVRVLPAAAEDAAQQAAPAAATCCKGLDLT
jgi:hypothetical protein